VKQDPIRNAVVTGGGSGIGRAVAVRLGRDGWRVAVLGRQEGPLRETATMIPSADVRVEVCDVGDPDAVDAVGSRLGDAWDGIDAVIAAAGMNIPRRGLRDLSAIDFRRLVEVNLLGAFHIVRTCVPLMRGRERATVVTIVSDAGLIASAKAGAGYVASKFGLTGLTESINAELRGEGIRATAIFPGDTDTALLDQRPVPPAREQRALMLQPDDVTECVLLAINLPHRAVLEKLVVRPR
jgi:NAD(P)-dependent dehydrogenase (short-subunit alcohol dehydrogenase family)